MPSGKLVRISEDTMEKLKDHGKPFETPNECINRLLGSRCNQNKKDVGNDGEES